jgi:TPR repeat protein
MKLLRAVCVMFAFLPLCVRSTSAQKVCNPSIEEQLAPLRGLNTASLESLRHKAESGDTDAQIAMGTAYHFGVFGVEDNKEAIRYYEMATGAGDGKAETLLAYVYGFLGKQKTAAAWNRKAADAGCVDAWLELSDAYMSGSGVQRDTAEGKKWIYKAAEANYALAQANLAEMLLFDPRIEHDPAEALKWAIKSAEQGNERGQYRAGFIYAFGSELKPPFAEDHVLGLMWFLIAQRNRNFSGQQPLATLKAKMTPQEINAAESKAREWLDHHKGTSPTVN